MDGDGKRSNRSWVGGWRKGKGGGRQAVEPLWGGRRGEEDGWGWQVVEPLRGGSRGRGRWMGMQRRGMAGQSVAGEGGEGKGKVRGEEGEGRKPNA